MLGSCGGEISSRLWGKLCRVIQVNRRAIWEVSGYQRYLCEALKVRLWMVDPPTIHLCSSAPFFSLVFWALPLSQHHFPGHLCDCIQRVLFGVPTLSGCSPSAPVFLLGSFLGVLVSSEFKQKALPHFQNHSFYLSWHFLVAEKLRSNSLMGTILIFLSKNQTTQISINFIVIGNSLKFWKHFPTSSAFQSHRSHY